MQKKNNQILILDFGSQYSQLIARRVRDLGVYCELYPYDVDDNIIQTFKPAGIILSGGPESVIEKHTPRIPKNVFDLNVPILGICYGMQALAKQLGGEVKNVSKREFGFAEVVTNTHSELLSNVGDELTEKNVPLLKVWMSHGDQVSKIPDGFSVIAKTNTCPIAAMENREKKLYGLQFHPEVTHTLQGKRILQRFIFDICYCQADWTPKNIIEHQIEKIKMQVKKEKVILGLSGGVDSSVVAVLLHQAIGDKLVCVFVNTGLLRLNEVSQVKKTFADHMKIQLICVDAQDRFFAALAGVEDPEEKRKIIGNVFVKIFEEIANDIQDAKWLAQGTIYPDVIESAGTHSTITHVIKSHHNVGGLPEKFSLKLLEPIRELFKDEVRKIGLELGLPYDMIYRHPFPGPGLGIRVLGEVKKEYVDLLQKADVIFIEELKKNNYYDKVSQAFCVFLPIKSVGVMGDARKYEYVICLRAVETIDFMTATWAKLPYEFIERVSNRIINEVSGVSRVVYDVSSKPPATIEWE